MRRRRAPKRELKPDRVYGSLLVTRFINCITRKGKKSKAERIFYEAMRLVEKKTKHPGIEVFQKAIDNVSPVLEVRPRRVGGATYQVPIEVNPHRKISLAIRWLLTYARARSGHSMVEKLAAELIDAANNQGGAVKKREDVHKMAEANRAFAHYKW